MTDLDLFDESEGVVVGRASDKFETFASAIPEDVSSLYEVYSYRNAAHILSTVHNDRFSEICHALRSSSFTEHMVRIPGGNEGPLTKEFKRHLDPKVWKELRIKADLMVSLLDAKKRKEVVLDRYTLHGYLDGHRIDFVSGRVAVDFEWNSKDQTYDRDLTAFSAFYDAGAIDVGVVVTRGVSINNTYLAGLGNCLRKDGVTETSKSVKAKFGASTTGMTKLLYRLDAGRNGGCPVLAIGITPDALRKQ